MSKNLVVINYISNVIEFYSYFITTCQLLQIVKSYNFMLFLPCLLLNNKFRLSQCSIARITVENKGSLPLSKLTG